MPLSRYVTEIKPRSTQREEELLTHR